MPLSRRYTPDWAPGESCNIGMDFSAVIPPGVSIVNATLDILSNTVPPAEAQADFQHQPITWSGRIVYIAMSGGIEGKDYQLVWTAYDSDGHRWPRTALMLCAPTS